MAFIRVEVTKDQPALEEVFLTLASTADKFEVYTESHASRIARLVDEMAKLFTLAREDRLSLRLAALAHDLGELAMRRDYISRVGPLSKDERFDLMRHTIIGEQEVVRCGGNRATQMLVRWHHEWWNGAGYPDALRGEEIPLAARILRVVDSYVSLTATRPFRSALTVDDACQTLAHGAGLEFDPRVVRAFLSLDRREEVKPEEPGGNQHRTSEPETIF